MTTLGASAVESAQLFVSRRLFITGGVSEIIVLIFSPVQLLGTLYNRDGNVSNSCLGR